MTKRSVCMSVIDTSVIVMLSVTTRHSKRKYNLMSSPKHRENNDLTTRHNKRKYNLMSSPKHRENNDLN
jgi:hypothetical protein